MNLSTSTLTLLPATLISGERRWESSFGARDGREMVSWELEPGEIESVEYSFHLSGPLRDMLGREAGLTVRYRVGEESVKRVEVHLERRR
jgi:hypothetical protein